MKDKIFLLTFSMAVAPSWLSAQTKIKVAYPTTVGSMAAVRRILSM